MRGFTNTIRYTAACTLLFITSIPSLARAQYWDEPGAVSTKPLITVTGEAVVYVRPDKCLITFGVEKSDIDNAKARDAVVKDAQSLVAALKQFGVTNDDIQVDSIMVSQRKHYADGDTPTARQSFTVTIRQIKQVDEILASALKSGATVVLEVDFQTSELRKHRELARQQAVKAAREKADLPRAAGGNNA